MEPTIPPLRDVKTILLSFRNDWNTAVLRHEVMMSQILKMQGEIQQEMATAMRSRAEDIPVDARVTLQPSDANGSAQFGNASKAAAKIDDTCEPFSPRRKDSGAGELDSPTSELKSDWQVSGGHHPSEAETIHSPDAETIRAHKSRRILGLIKDRHHFGFGVRDIADEENTSLRGRLNRVLSCKECELTLSFLIVCNAVIICLESQYHGLEVGFILQYPGRPQPAVDTWPGAETIFDIADWIFGLLFLIEFMLKFVVWSYTYFNDGWNVLDFLCVASFLVDKVVLAYDTFNATPLRLLRLFRLARLVRLIRFLEHLEALYVMTTAIGGLSRTLGWAIFLLTVMLLTCDLFLVQLLQATYFSDVNPSEFTNAQLERHQEMYEYFGTSTRCMLSMFEITLGNWPPIARLLCEEVSEWFTLLCLVHKLTLGFAVLGVINGVILQETFKVAQTDDIIMLRHKKKATQAMKAKMDKLFQAMDSDNDGKVTEMEFLQMCEYPDVKIWLSSLDIETDDLPTLFQLCDINHNGNLSLEEVVTRLPRIKGSARSIDVLTLLHKDGVP